jgi:hypothetical protein
LNRKLSYVSFLSFLKYDGAGGDSELQYLNRNS